MVRGGTERGRVDGGRLRFIVIEQRGLVGVGHQCCSTLKEGQIVPPGYHKTPIRMIVRAMTCSVPWNLIGAPSSRKSKVIHGISVRDDPRLEHRWPSTASWRQQIGRCTRVIECSCPAYDYRAAHGCAQPRNR